MAHISKNEFQTLNWLPATGIFNQSINSIVFRYFTNQWPTYLSEIFELACLNNVRTKKLSEIDFSFSKNQHGTKRTLFHCSLSIEQNPRNSHKTNNINTFKHNLNDIT